MKIALAMMVLALTGCSAKSLKKDFAGDSDLQVIDVHTHTIFTGASEPFSKIPMTEAEFFSELASVNAVGAVGLTVPLDVETYIGKVPTYHDLRSKNVIHCAGVSSRIDKADLEKKLKSGTHRCIKIYLGYVHQYAYDKHYEPAYELAEKYDVPVIFHTGDTYSDKAKLKFSHPLTIDEVAVQHRKVRFVIAHCGNPWIRDAAEVAYKNSNVYLDGSGFMIGNLDDQPAEKVEKYMVDQLRWVFGYVEDPKKLMYGTDWPLVRMDSYLRAFRKAIPREHWKDVFHDNAVRVFKL